MRSVDDIGDELYVLPPAMFTAARDAAVAQARADGDAAAARRLASLKRPTQGAYLVNLLALRRPDVVTDLISLGEQIRAAQGTVSARELRALTARRREALGAALAQCRSLAAQAGAGEPSSAQIAEAEATLAAAMADPATAEVVRSGRVVKALSYAGFGTGSGTTAALKAPSTRAAGRRGPTERAPDEAVRPAARAAADATADAATRDQQAELERQRRELQRAAQERLAQAEAELAEARAREQAADGEVDRIAEEIARLRSALDEASRQARAARATRQAAERDVAAARRAVEAAR